MRQPTKVTFYTLEIKAFYLVKIGEYTLFWSCDCIFIANTFRNEEKKNEWDFQFKNEQNVINMFNKSKNDVLSKVLNRPSFLDLHPFSQVLIQHI